MIQCCEAFCEGEKKSVLSDRKQIVHQQNLSQESNANTYGLKAAKSGEDSEMKLPVILLDPPPDNGSGGDSNEAQKGATVVVNGPPLALVEDDNRLSLLHDLPRLTERRSSNRDLRRLQRRRGSSFAEYFDVDFGQSLLSRKQFSRKNSYALDLAQRLEKENTKQDSLWASATTSIYNGNEVKIDGEHKTLLSSLPCNWFFSNRDESAASFSNTGKTGRRASLIVMVSEEGQKISLLQVAQENFTAVSSVKELSLGAPLSQ